MRAAHIIKMFDEKRYADCRNYCDWAFDARPDVFNPDSMPEEYRCLAVSTFRTGDVLRAKPMLERLLTMREYGGDAELRRMLDAASAADRSRIAVLCENESITPEINRLTGMIGRLTHVYTHIRKTISVYVPEDQADYERAFRERYPDTAVYPYDAFMAFCEGSKPTSEWMVFKPQHIALSVPDLALEGMVAHELSHIDMRSAKIGELMYRALPGLEMKVNEHLTDLHVMELGLAYPLYCSRNHFGASGVVLPADSVIGYLDSLQRV